MSRYFIEVSYKGTHYSGFQVQHNAHTIQSEVEKALNTVFRLPAQIGQAETGIKLTGSSRTDAGVHALQNFFHFDTDAEIISAHIYNLNAVLPGDIAVHEIYKVNDAAHCRFDAVSRSYVYTVYQKKNPFLRNTSYFYPYPLQLNLLNEAAQLLKQYENFEAFSKRNTQVKTFNCNIYESNWQCKDGVYSYHVTANRFLRGMVRALTATMLRVGRGKISIDDFKRIIEAKDCTKAFFDVPAHGLMLAQVLIKKQLS